MLGLGFGCFAAGADGSWEGPSEDPAVWIVSPILGSAIGVYLAGDRNSEIDTYNRNGWEDNTIAPMSFSASLRDFLATLAGSALGFGLPFGIAKLAGLELDSDSPEAIIPIYVSAIACASIGATIAFNLTSSADLDDQSSSAAAPVYLNLMRIQF